MAYCIYMHRNKHNGKVYIGKAEELYRPDGGLRRWGYEGANYHVCSAISQAFRKYGWSAFDHIILIHDLTEEEAYQKEQELIASYNSIAPNGYNLCLGGKGSGGHKQTEAGRKANSEWHKGRPLSEEHKQHIREACNHPAVREKMSKAHKGVPLKPAHKEHMVAAVKKVRDTPAYREHLKAAMKGIKPQPHVLQAAAIAKYKRVRCVETGITYESQVAAEKATGIDHKAISNSVRIPNRTAGGFHWIYD